MRVTTETKAATRQRILEAAQSLFNRQGFDAATTRDIARAAQIAAGTLFNYFPTKESIAMCLVAEAHAQAVEHFQAGPAQDASEPLSLEEELFAHVAAGLRKLKPYRKYLTAVLDTSLSPLHSDQADGEPSLRVAHLEAVSQIVARHKRDAGPSTVALHLYWTLYTGVLVFWSKDASPRQEETLALLDQSLAMFVGWLSAPTNSTEPPERRG
ncbi:MAG: TetR/AcrR family transcriptional regulator [Pirellulaceae bacterium]